MIIFEKGNFHNSADLETVFSRYSIEAVMQFVFVITSLIYRVSQVILLQVML